MLSTIALILLGRFIIRPLVIGFSARFGLRAMVIAGTVLSAMQYPFLAEVHAAGFALAMLVAIASVGDTVYWTTYHAYFASLGDAEHRGHQIGAREAISSLAAIVGPLLGGWALATVGPRIAFAVTLGNHPSWRIKATYVARRIVMEYLSERAEKARSAPRVLAAR